MEILHDADVDYLLVQDNGRNIDPPVGLLGTNPENILTRLKRAIEREVGQGVLRINVEDIVDFYAITAILEDYDTISFKLKRIYNY